MRGIVVKINDANTVVMFNNGKIGTIPTPPGCKTGMVISVSLNRKLVAVPVLAAFFIIALSAVFLIYYFNYGISPESFCKTPFLQKNIVIPKSEYDTYAALFNHLGHPLGEFTTNYPPVKNNDDTVRGFNFKYYNLVTYYSQSKNRITICEIVMNSKDTVFTGNFSIGDDKSSIERVFRYFVVKNKQGVVFSTKNNNIQFTIQDTILVFKFSGKNKLTGVTITYSSSDY